MESSCSSERESAGDKGLPGTPAAVELGALIEAKEALSTS
jgi:hypothetical protein